MLEIETDAGLRVCRVNAVNADDGFSVDVTTGMGVPAFAPRTVTLPGGVQVEGVEVSTGNPHFVIVVDNAEFAVDGQRWQSVGQQICGHPDFPQQTNVEFVRIVSADEIEIRIFERGVGPTTSSGTGTSAAAVAAIALRGCGIAVARGGAGRRADGGVERAGDGAATHRSGGADCARRGMVMEAQPLIALREVPAGAGVSIIAPASFARQERIENGENALRGLGFEPRFEAICAEARTVVFCRNG